MPMDSSLASTPRAHRPHAEVLLQPIYAAGVLAMASASVPGGGGIGGGGGSGRLFWWIGRSS